MSVQSLTRMMVKMSDWIENLESGFHWQHKQRTIQEEWTADSMKGLKPKVHWCMELNRGWGASSFKPYTRVQCQTNPTKYMMYYDDYDIPQQYKCKHCTKQWEKMQQITHHFERYKFYRLGDIQAFICKLEMSGFSNFNIYYMYMSSENNLQEWTREITHEFGKRISSRDVGQLKKMTSRKKTVQFWKRYYKLNKV